MAETPKTVPVINRGRLEFLVDGVFAIALTILVLELKVPELADRRSIAELGQALAHEAPTFISYLASFMLLGIFWYRHNHQYEHFRVITRGMLVLHFVQLAAAAFLPFCAALLGRYPVNGLSIVVYLGCVLVYAWASAGTWILAQRSGAMTASLTEAAYAESRRRWLRGCLVLSALFTLYVIRLLVN
jgi:uncharacterized membrane protein